MVWGKYRVKDITKLMVLMGALQGKKKSFWGLSRLLLSNEKKIENKCVNSKLLVISRGAPVKKNPIVYGARQAVPRPFYHFHSLLALINLPEVTPITNILQPYSIWV